MPMQYHNTILFVSLCYRKGLQERILQTCLSKTKSNTVNFYNRDQACTPPAPCGIKQTVYTIQR